MHWYNAKANPFPPLFVNGPKVVVVQDPQGGLEQLCRNVEVKRVALY